MTERERPRLSERERQLLELAAEGLTDTAIAQQLGISEATVSTYWGRVRIKLGPYNRTELVAKALTEKSEEALASLREENLRLAEKLRLQSGDYEGSSHNFYKDLLENAADAILVVSSEGIIDNLSEEAASLFGYSREELVGSPVSQLIPDRFRRAHDAHRNAYVLHPERKRMGEHEATLALHKSGKEIPIAATLSAIQVESSVSILCILREVTLDL